MSVFKNVFVLDETVLLGNPIKVYNFTSLFGWGFTYSCLVLGHRGSNGGFPLVRYFGTGV